MVNGLYLYRAFLIQLTTQSTFYTTCHIRCIIKWMRNTLSFMSCQFLTWYPPSSNVSRFATFWTMCRVSLWMQGGLLKELCRSQDLHQYLLWTWEGGNISMWGHDNFLFHNCFLCLLVVNKLYFRKENVGHYSLKMCGLAHKVLEMRNGGRNADNILTPPHL